MVGLFTMTDKFYKDSRSNLQAAIFIFVLNMDLFRMRTILVRSLFGLLLYMYVQAKNPGRIFSNIDFLELDASQAYTSTWNRGFTVGLNVGF